ncbi:MAG: primosomal protein N' [Planctomycetota bacterium]|nr:primosomal protein N' [Planctomycetota bacterium]
MNRLFEEPAADAREAHSGLYARVALEQGIDASAAGLTYAVPAALADLRVGERVVVPLGRGNKSVSGYVLEINGHTEFEPAKVKAILARDRQGISLTPDLMELATWMAGYYCCPIGMVLATMLPAAVKRGVGRTAQVMVGLSPEAAERAAAPPEPPEVPPSTDVVPLVEVSPPAEAATTETSGETPSKPSRRSSTKAAPKPKPWWGDARLSKHQAAVLDASRAAAGTGERWIEIKALADRGGAKSIAPVRQLIDKGLLVARHQEVVMAMRGGVADGRDDTTARATSTHALNPSQQKAVDDMAASIGGGFHVHLLHGVTGSGKTEVYLRVLERMLTAANAASAANAAKSADSAAAPVPAGAIVLVPEIALTPQTVSRFVERFEAVAVMHSGLTAAQRHEQWRRIRDGEARIVVGARSAIFAPLANLRVVIVDEEHESSYKQDQLPRYQARDVAIRRAQLLGIPVLLGSATPSLESYYNATDPAGKKGYRLHELPERVAGLALPTVEIVDMSQERRKRYGMTGGAGVHLLSLRLEKVIQQALEAKGQVMLLLNRRGYANYIACPDHRCGWMMNCDLCDATMVYHKDANLPVGGLVRCHHCTAEQLLPTYCPTCGKKVTVFGLGTQRVEEEIGKKFPGARLMRMDSDVMRTARDYHRSLERFRNGEIDVLVGTQMIAKGLDFPDVHVVGVISADTALHMPDFRASERTFQLIAQVAGRAGRGGKDNPGRVIVQTFSPDDAAITLAAAHDYETFAKNEIALRKQVGLPPAARMARIVVRDEDHIACTEQAQKLADGLAGCNATLGGQINLRGPSPCPIGRIAGYFRQQIELLGPDAAAIQRLLTAARNGKLLHADHRTAVDVDPVALM